MKYALLVLFALGTLTASARPGDRYVLIGSFESTNPFNWDNDTVTSNLRDWSEAMIFEIDRGGRDIQIRDIVVNCQGRPNCFRSRGGTLTDSRPVRVQFRRDMVVESIQVQSKPSGLSIPPTRVNVYLEVARGGGW